MFNQRLSGMPRYAVTALFAMSRLMMRVIFASGRLRLLITAEGFVRRTAAFCLA